MRAKTAHIPVNNPVLIVVNMSLFINVSVFLNPVRPRCRKKMNKLARSNPFRASSPSIVLASQLMVSHCIMVDIWTLKHASDEKHISNYDTYARP